MKSKECFIYGIKEPTTDRIRYVGLSTQGMTRPLQHFMPCYARHETSHKSNWIKKHFTGVDPRPFIVILERCDRSNVEEREIFWIGKLRSEGVDLVNMTDGGSAGLGRRFSSETRAKISRSKKGQKHSPEARAKMSASHLGVPVGTRRPKRPVIDQNGRTYGSITEAGKQLNLSIGNIAKCLNGSRPHTGGYSFKYIELNNG